MPPVPTARPASRARPPRTAARRRPAATGLELVIITGLSGSGKGSVVKVFEDAGYYCVDNLPVRLLQHLVDLVRQSGEVERMAVVVDIREGERLGGLPDLIAELRREGVKLQLLFLEAGDEILQRRFSETRRPHPLARGGQVARGIQAERKALAPLRAGADVVIDTSHFNAHELRDFIQDRVIQGGQTPRLHVALTSFGFRNGLPADADLVFDVRFLPNPNYVAALRPHDGRNAKVAAYVRSFPQTGEFLRRLQEMLAYLLPHYVKEGKSYLNIAIGCTGGKHRSVFVAEALRRGLRRLGYHPSLTHRDLRHAGGR